MASALSDAIQLCDGVAELGGLVVGFVQGWLGTSGRGSIPGEARTLAAVVETIIATIKTLKNTPANDTCLAVVKNIEAELTNAKAILEKWKLKEKKFMFNPKTHIAATVASTERLKSLFDLLEKARSLTEGKNVNPATLITDPVARKFWCTSFGDVVSASYLMFVVAFKNAYGLPAPAVEKLKQGGPPVLDVYRFNEVTKAGIKNLIAICDYTNPFAEQLQPGATPSKPLVHNDMIGRRVNWAGAPPLAVSEAARSFVIWSDLGGVLQPKDCSNQPGCPVIVAPYAEGVNAQHWKFDKFGCVYNMHSGLVLDVDLQARDGVMHVIQWPRHAGANQQWKLYPDGSFRAKLYRDQQCMDVDTTSKEVIMYYWRGNRPNQMFRVSNDVQIGDSPLKGSPINTTAPTDLVISPTASFPGRS
ncbi:hypothetical protein Pelo_2251 [Pelomyxa schiedti]|nr:hypothetical protein Pelo_2251 [Pelomyxa schiedti]